jgi:hypothetical protein
MTTPVWYRGETINYVLTVTVDGAAYDLTTATAIELQLKAGPGSADPALASLSLAGGEIVRRTQSGTTLGQADVEIPSTWHPGRHVLLRCGGGLPGPDPAVRRQAPQGGCSRRRQSAVIVSPAWKTFCSTS